MAGVRTVGATMHGAPRAGYGGDERAVALSGADEGTPVDEARARFTLARALLAAKQRGEALVEARKARDAYRGGGPEAASELAAVERWLAEHDR